MFMCKNAQVDPQAQQLRRKCKGRVSMKSIIFGSNPSYCGLIWSSFGLFWADLVYFQADSGRRVAS